MVCRIPCFLNIIYLLYDVLYDPLLFVVQVYTIGRSTVSPGRSTGSSFVKTYASEKGNSISPPVVCFSCIYYKAFMIPWAVFRISCFLNVIYLKKGRSIGSPVGVVRVYFIGRSTVSSFV